MREKKEPSQKCLMRQIKKQKKEQGNRIFYTELQHLSIFPISFNLPQYLPLLLFKTCIDESKIDSSSTEMHRLWIKRTKETVLMKTEQVFFMLGLRDLHPLLRAF